MRPPGVAFVDRIRHCSKKRFDSSLTSLRSFVRHDVSSLHKASLMPVSQVSKYATRMLMQYPETQSSYCIRALQRGNKACS